MVISGKTKHANSLNHFTGTLNWTENVSNQMGARCDEEKQQTEQRAWGEHESGHWDSSEQCCIWHGHRKLEVWACETKEKRADTHSWDQSRRAPPSQTQTRHKLSIILFGWCPNLHIGHFNSRSLKKKKKRYHLLQKAWICDILAVKSEFRNLNTNWKRGKS